MAYISDPIAAAREEEGVEDVRPTTTTDTVDTPADVTAYPYPGINLINHHQYMYPERCTAANISIKTLRLE